MNTQYIAMYSVAGKALVTLPFCYISVQALSHIRVIKISGCCDQSQ